MLVLSFFIVFTFFILGIYFSKLKILIKKLDFEIDEKINIKKDYKICIGIYLYGVIKICNINLDENGIRFLWIKIPYCKIKDIKLYKKMIERDAIELDRKILKNELHDLEIRFEKINLNLMLGTDSTLITSFLTFVVSTITSFIIQKTVLKYNPSKHKYIITPKYDNKNSLKIYLELLVCLKTRNILKIINNLNKLSKMEHIKHKIKFKEIEI